MNCPLCSTEMKAVPQAGVTLDVCPACGAGWFDATELAATTGGDGSLERALRLASHMRDTCRVCGEAVPNPGDAGVTHCGVPVRLSCARCGATMSAVHAKPMAVDACQWCGSLLIPGPAMATLGELVAPPLPEPPPPELAPGFEASAITQLVASSWGGRVMSLLGI